MTRDLLIGIDAGTSVVKAVAFDLDGQQLALASTPNRYTTLSDGSAFQSLNQTWQDCVQILRELGDQVPNLAARTAALAVTAQGDGTWLIDGDGAPVGDGWLWLDSRAASTVRRLRTGVADQSRFELTGTGLNSCQQGAQLAHMNSINPEQLDAAATALHCKDWLYFNLTGERVTDPSEANFTFGDFRTRHYSDAVIDALELTGRKYLLPPIADGTRQTHGLAAAAASTTGLREGTPVSLGFVDVVCTALGAGLYTPGAAAGCTILGSTGMHMRATTADGVCLNADKTGYVMVLPIDGLVAQIQSNMAATLNIDWVLALASDLASDLGHQASQGDLIARVDGWISASQPGQLLYQPYISEAGERGPFVDNAARAGFVGLDMSHRFPDLVRAVVEGLGMAARDCYAAMGEMPAEVRLTGGATGSDAVRNILSAALGAPVRPSTRGEAGAAGAAMIAAVAIGAFDTMDDCIAKWVSPLLAEAEAPDPALAEIYASRYPAYLAARQALTPIWGQMAAAQEVANV